MMDEVEGSNRLRPTRRQWREAKEKMRMKKLQTPMWLVIVGAVLIVLLVGAVAWAATWAATNDNDERGPGFALGAGQDVQGSHVVPGGMGAVREGLASRREAMHERQQQSREHRQEVIEGIREDMSPEDQQKCDELTATIEAQKDGLQAARQELADTLKELRALIYQYLDANGGAVTDDGGN
jgi:uncharacterized membrane protein